jgi:hypothetical protein
MSTVKIIIDGLVAFGTLAVAVMAIWGEKVRSWLAPPKLIIVPHTPHGDPTQLTMEGAVNPGGGQRAMYFHLKVVNLRTWLTVENCRILLKGISRRGPDGKFHPVPMAVPLQFVWAPAEATPPQVTITKEQILDFGMLVEGTSKFIPILYSHSNNFQGFVEKGQAVRYFLEIDASNFASPHPQVFEVAWDGEWDFEPEKMQHHLRLTEIR